MTIGELDEWLSCAMFVLERGDEAQQREVAEMLQKLWSLSNVPQFLSYWRDPTGTLRDINTLIGFYRKDKSDAAGMEAIHRLLRRDFPLRSFDARWRDRTNIQQKVREWGRERGIGGDAALWERFAENALVAVIEQVGLMRGIEIELSPHVVEETRKTWDEQWNDWTPEQQRKSLLSLAKRLLKKNAKRREGEGYMVAALRERIRQELKEEIERELFGRTLRELRAEQRALSDDPPPTLPELPSAGAERLDAEMLLTRIKPDDADLFRRYAEADEEGRKKLAAKMGWTMGRLQKRVSRIRSQLVSEAEKLCQ